MEILHSLLLFLHLLGMAIIVGAYFATIRAPRVSPGMLHGAYLQLVTGLLLVGLLEMGGGDVNHAKIAVKLILAIAVAVLAFLGKRKEKAQPDQTPAASAGLAHGVAVAGILAVAVAVFW